jgi:hypothetical protein
MLKTSGSRVEPVIYPPTERLINTILATFPGGSAVFRAQHFIVLLSKSRRDRTNAPKLGLNSRPATL